MFVICGGQGASKTISILELVIQSLLASEKEATVLSSELSKMKRTVIRDYKKICKDWSIINNEDEFNRSESKHEYPNGSYIDFLGADVNDVGKGFRRDILYINEADKMNVETAIQFISRSKLTIIDYNPDNRFWGYDFINENNFITLTFEDNEYLPEQEVKSILNYKERGFRDTSLKDLFIESNIKSKYWANRWRVYGMGMLGMLDGVVFENWSKIKELPKEAEIIAYGLDWGFSISPTALISVYKWQGKLIVHEHIYQTGLLNEPLINLMNQLGIRRDVKIICDSEDPKSIQEVSLAGYWAVKCEKGSDKNKQAIAKLQEYEILVTESSYNIQHELANFTWIKNNNGEFTGETIKKYDHAIDCLKYIAYTELNPTPSIDYMFV